MRFTLECTRQIFQHIRPGRGPQVVSALYQGWLVVRDSGEMLTRTDDVEAEGQNEVVFEADGDCC